MKYHWKPLKTLCALTLALVLASGAPAGAAGLLDWFTGRSSDPTPTPEISLPTPTPEPEVPASSLTDDGLLRVFLRSLKSPETLHLTLAGVYAVEGDPGFRFERGTEVTLTAANGEVWLTAGGVTIDMGGSVTLTRHAAAEGDENGIYIQESEKDALYCGDLAVSTDKNGALYPILTLPVEDYLYGVVAYEMSDSFPLEALKAQAVAARTYAMQRKSAGRREYDLVDTASDQVFKGYDGEYTNVIEAVNATRGVVGTWNGGYAGCYFTASNGGQTALASQIWGGTASDGYLAMKDDPYDLENPRSLVNDLTVSASCEGSLKLRQLLTDGLGNVMEQEGIAEADWAFDSIAAVEPVKPRYPGSYMYDGLAFDLRVKVAESALPTPTPEPTPTPAPTATGDPGTVATAEPTATPTSAPTEAAPPRSEKWVLLEDTRQVVLDVYDDIKDGLSLGLNGQDCELISVETEADKDGRAKSFRIMMRRYGHGVGMSQRGAQWMAGHYGMGWQQILKFYYPGMALERMAWPEAALTALEDLPDAVGAARIKPTPNPTPAPLPPLEEGEYYARVTADSLNVRQSPTTAAAIVDVLARNRRVIVRGDADADGWVPVRTAELEGFVKLEYLKKE